MVPVFPWTVPFKLGGRGLEGDTGGAQVVVVSAVPVSLLEVGPPQVGADRGLTIRLGLALVAQERVGVLHGGGVDGHLIRVSDRNVVAIRRRQGLHGFLPLSLELVAMGRFKIRHSIVSLHCWRAAFMH